MALAVTPVNDAPVNSVPSFAAVAEDGALVFSTASDLAIIVSDNDALTTEPLQVTLSVGHGSLTLASLDGLTFVAGDGNDDAWVSFRGLFYDLTAALDGLTYLPMADFSGTDTLTVTSNDLGNIGTGGALSDTDNVPITVTPVNDAPIAADTSVTTDEDTVLTGVLPAATDVDGDDITYGLDTHASHGTAVLSADGSYTYTPNLNFNGSDSFGYTVSDGNGGRNTYTVDVDVEAVNDAPVNSLPSPATIEEDDTLVFSFADDRAIIVSDNDALAAEPLTVTLAVNHGQLTLAGTSGLTISEGDGTADRLVTFSGLAPYS